MHRPCRAALPLLLLVLLLQGCTLGRAQIRRTDAVAAASMDTRSTCGQPDHCAQPSPLLEAADQALADSTPGHPQHVVALLGASEPALAARLNLIRAARRSIDVQTYIWDHDDAGLLVLDELVHAAWRGVKVRILVDQLSAFGDADLIDRLARASPNFAVKLYNPTFDKAQSSAMEWAAGIACCFLRFNQRMHNKVMVVDGEIGITGGRNYQDRYFDWDAEFDYVDRDVLVGGPAAQAMAASFEQFWTHPRSVPLTHLRDVSRRLLAHPQAPGWPAPAYAHPERVQRVRQEADDGDWLRAYVLDDSVLTGNVEFFSDLPGKTEDPGERAARALTRHVMQLFADAKQEVVLQTPYLVMSKRASRVFRALRKQGAPPRIVVSTNSLASTDDFAVYAITYKHRGRYLKQLGFEIYELKPHASGPTDDNAWAGLAEEPDGPAAPAAPAGKGKRRYIRPEQTSLLGSRGRSNRPAPLHSAGRRFGLHAKSFVVDGDVAMVGSHNFDPRSDHYNTEAGVIVYDDRFAVQLRDAILRDTTPDNAWVVAPRKPVPVLTPISQAIGEVSERLPLFDFWPFRYATNYDLKAGCTPMRPGDPAFLSCYEPVGDFPDVAISPRLIYTRLLTAFGVGIQGIL